jgi:clan AA aspartic protease (TIGR02281 family)
MWIVAVFLWALLGSGTAAAFDCANATLPSSLVICGDPELIGRADERQEAINEARGRIGEDRWPALWEDQKAWVRSYATACGVPPDRLPPFPASASIRACFNRAAVARIAYLRAYGVTAGSAPASPSPGAASRDRIGPSYDCSIAGYPLALMICADSDLSRLDLRFGQAYWALFQQLGPAGQPQLKEEDLTFFDQVQGQCHVPRSGPLTAEAWQSRDCVRDAYEKMREAWLARLTGPAYEEAVRSSERHVALQRALQETGFLPPGSIDGVYGPATRSAIVAWQTTRGVATTGLLGDADAREIEREVIASRLPDRLSPAAPLPGAEAIALRNNGGVYVVAVRINGAITLDFIVDSGASDVLIPADVAMTLARAGTIAEGDFIGDQEYRIGDGSTLKSARFILRELKVGSRVVQNVIASIGSVRGEPLLGQSFLARFGSWSIDNDRHLLALGQPRQ